MTNKPRPKLKPLSQRPEPTPPGYPFGYPRHWYDEHGNIILIPGYEYCSSKNIDELKFICERYGIECEKYGKLVKRVKGDRRGKLAFLEALKQERHKRREASNALEAYRFRRRKWRMVNGDAAA